MDDVLLSGNTFWQPLTCATNLLRRGDLSVLLTADVGLCPTRLNLAGRSEGALGLGCRPIPRTGPARSWRQTFAFPYSLWMLHPWKRTLATDWKRRFFDRRTDRLSPSNTDFRPVFPLPQPQLRKLVHLTCDADSINTTARHSGSEKGLKAAAKRAADDACSD